MNLTPSHSAALGNVSHPIASVTSSVLKLGGKQTHRVTHWPHVCGLGVSAEAEK